MLRRLRPSPAMVIALIALFVSLGGVGYAATKIGTSQIRDGAVTAAKLHGNAVTRKKIAAHAIGTVKLDNGAVTGAKLASGSVSASKVDSSIVTAGSPGVAFAGVNVAANGTVQRSFNRVGGTITVSHPSTGVYNITVPGLEGKLASTTSLSVAALESFGAIRLRSSGGNPVIETANLNGVLANRPFQWVAFLQSP